MSFDHDGFPVFPQRRLGCCSLLFSFSTLDEVVLSLVPFIPYFFVFPSFFLLPRLLTSDYYFRITTAMSTLPPTTHALPQTHRAHLIQSTRKLGALLGETPLLLEPQGHHSRNSSISSISSTTSNESNASKRSGRIFADAQPRSSSLAPADPALVSTATHAPRPVLLLRLASPRPTSMVSPISPSFQLSPITPTFVVDRRKKMAKLVRTLGTNVPPSSSSAPPPKPRSRTVPSPRSCAVSLLHTGPTGAACRTSPSRTRPSPRPPAKPHTPPKPTTLPPRAATTAGSTLDPHRTRPPPARRAM
ncbi:hypothetical protein B0H14DRAFT_1081106 [Mycena olivaceomarginata]|nr:hypothetical protein B0H14DRAFT_1081106 [Mycena olivaceomarginata]